MNCALLAILPVSKSGRKRSHSEIQKRATTKGANLDPDDFLGGVETLTEAQARLALDTSAGHASTRAYAEVMKTAGMHDRMQQDGRVRMQDASGNSLDAPSMSAAMQLIDALRNK